MNLTLGGDPKKVKFLGGLLVVLVGVWFYNSTLSSDAGPSGPPSSTPAAPKEVGSLPTPPMPIARRDANTPQKRAGSRQQLRSNVQEFKPKLFDKDNPVDPTKVDPMLGIELLAKLQRVTLSGGGRSLFDFGASAPIDVPKGPIIKPVQKPKGTYVVYGPVKPPPIVEAVKAAPPPPPPIPLKFYGFVLSKRDGAKRAFFMEGEEIYIASEGETMKKRYKLVRIGVNSALVEDTTTKHQQSLPLIEEQQATND